MKIVDVNVLIYAIDRRSPHHEPASNWLQQALNGHEPVGFPWLSLLGFMRIATNRRAYPHPLSINDACDVVAEWLDQPSAVVVEPPLDHLDRVRDLLEPLGAAGNLVNDAHIAALAAHHKAEVVTFDNDFDRFDGVRRLTPT